MRLLYFLILVSVFISCKQAATVLPKRKNIVEAVYASGKILSENEYYAYALNGGYIVKKIVKDGDIVKKGQILYVINSDVPSSNVDAARSGYENVKISLSTRSAVLNDLRLTWESVQLKFKNDSLQYNRLKNLFEQGIGTQSALDNAHTNFLVSLNQVKSAEARYFSTVNDLEVSYQNAKSKLANAEADLRNTYIKSELDGAVYQTLKEAGEAVRPNDPVALIGAAEKRIIKLAVDQLDISKVVVGQEVLLKTDVTGNTIYHAAIKQIYPSMNETDQTFRVDAVFTEAGGQPFIHSSVEANIIIQKKDKALIIPRAALLANDSVQIRQGNKAVMVWVKTGIKTLEDVEIISGINQSSQIVLPSQK